MRKISKILATLLSTITLISSASIVDAMDSGESPKSTNSDESTATNPDFFVELVKLVQQMSRKMARMESFVEGVQLAYTEYRHVENVAHCTLENGETMHITRHTLEASREESIRTLEECICDLQSVIATRIPRSVVRPACETKDQLYALALFSDIYASIRSGAGTAIPRDYLINMLSIGKQEGPQSDGFNVNNVNMWYKNGLMIITCCDGEKITRKIAIGEYYK